MKQFNTLYKEAKYAEAARVASMAHELDPDNSIASAAMQISKMQINRNTAKELKEKKNVTVLNALNDAEDPGDTAGAIRDGAADTVLPAPVYADGVTPPFTPAG